MIDHFQIRWRYVSINAQISLMVFSKRNYEQTCMLNDAIDQLEKNGLDAIFIGLLSPAIYRSSAKHSQEIL